MNERRLQLIQRRAGWNYALARLVDLFRANGDGATVNADGFGLVYQHR